MDEKQIRLLRLPEKRKKLVRLQSHPLCEKCNSEIPATILVDGKRRNLKSRKLCLDCKPFKFAGKVELPKAKYQRLVVECKFCNKQFNAKPSEVARTRNKYCSRTCSDKAKQKGKQVNCHVCNKTLYRGLTDLAKCKTQTFFCGLSCRSKWTEKVMPTGKGHVGWKGGKGSYRARAKREYGLKCNNVKCPIKIEITESMFDVDHIDGNRDNNDIKNLQVLCVWCHAVKTRLNDRE